LVKDDGQPMLESMDMITHVESPGVSVFTGPQRSEMAAWAGATADKTAVLTWPRYPLLRLPEFATIAARDHYVIRKRKSLGDLTELRARTREFVDALMPHLEKLDAMIESSTAVNGELSLDDIRVLPLFRSAAVVKGLHFPHEVRDYFEAMMNRIGYRPLPVI
jgi:glutaredoxin 2